MATDDPRAATAVDPDGRDVVLLVRIWEDKIVRDHPELASHLDAVIQTVATPDHLEPGHSARSYAVLPTRRRPEPLADGGRKL